MSNLIINKELFTNEFNSIFELTKEEQNRINGQCEIHVSHVNPVLVSQEEHQNMHSRTSK